MAKYPAFLIVMMLAACGDSEQSIDYSQPDIETTIDELVAAYDANEMAAQQEFGNRVVRVSGIVRSVVLTSDDEPMLNFESDNLIPTQAKFVDATGADVLTKGDAASVICSEVSETMGSPMLAGCIVSN